MSSLKKLTFLLGLFLYFLLPGQTFAQEKIDEFKVNITARQDGTMTIEENIKYDFGQEQRHGIFRDIPLVSRVGELYREISINFLEIKRDGEEEDYKVNLMDNEVSVRIGDPNETITGVHDYFIRYKVENGIGSNYEDHDEIYWNVTGNDWEIPINFASANIYTDFGVEPNRVTCFSRSSNFSAQFCHSAPNPPFNPIVTTASIQPGDGLTIVAAFPVNTFPKSFLQTEEPKKSSDFGEFLEIYPLLLGFLNFILAPGLLFWYHAGKSKVRFGKPSVNFDLPKLEGKVLPPAEIGIIDNTELEKNDVVATIFDLAIRKYLKIEEVKKVKPLMPDENDYKLIKLKEDEELDEFEKSLLEYIFKEQDSVMLKDSKLDFSNFHNLEVKNFRSLVRKKLYIENPRGRMTILKSFGLFALITLNLILGGVLLFLAKKLNGRTQLGDKIDFQVDGLKIFLKSMSRHHGWQAKSLITVEKYIPYAIALGLHEEFMEQLKIVAPDYNPTWYTGGSGFYYGYAGMYSSMSSSVITSAPASSSGFSGGSGGGGGGGGGGSW